MADFKNFLEYTKKWTDPKLLNDLNTFMFKFMNEAGQELIIRVKLRTPVDTGALRAAWQVSKCKKDGNEYYIEIENDMDYASFVESGTVSREWKWKNGAFMLAKSMNEMQLKLPDRFEKEFTKFLKDRGIG